MRDFVIKNLRRVPILSPFWEEFERVSTARDAALRERDAALVARDAAIAERDRALAARDAALTERDPMAVPLPPEEYMSLVCGADLPMPELEAFFHAIGRFLMDFLDGQKMLEEHARVLDIGCGCGRLPRNLLDRKIASYTGFDRHSGMINWCAREITKRDPRFAFHFFSIKSVYQTLDHYDGEIPASEFKFPFSDNSFDSVLAASVFTHMSMSEVSNYLSEIRRVLSPDGKVMLSVFFNEDDPDKERVLAHNFYFGGTAFLNIVKSAGFDYRFAANTGEHRWYSLRHAVGRGWRESDPRREMDKMAQG
jgi:SAM-dependent methyltransferase